jgi:XTP/dITP diphosphohydrolase
MGERLRVVCASANPDKVAEIAAVLGDSVELLARPDSVGEVIEDADTLEGNARLKAVAIARATGLPAIADDTGLEVDALGGEPGVYTARYAGPNATYADNRAKLLRELGDRPRPERTACFATVALVYWPDGREVAARGECRGWIAETERGSRGFGYDAVFIPADDDGRTFAEMSEHEKHAVSHRGRAFRRLVELLADTH